MKYHLIRLQLIITYFLAAGSDWFSILYQNVYAVNHKFFYTGINILRVDF